MATPETKPVSTSDRGGLRANKPARRRSPSRWVRDQGLSLILASLFAVFLVGQSLTGFAVLNEEQHDHGRAEISYGSYLTSSHFIEATFENWESEFLQMGAYVLLTVFFFQRGSAESNDPDRPPRRPRARSAGQWLYANSLSLAFFGLFAASFVLHAIGGAASYSQQQEAHGGAAISTLGFMATATFWFESFQNWQSEFLAIFAMVVLTVFLRQEGSPESKPVGAPHSQTGKGD